MFPVVDQPTLLANVFIVDVLIVPKSSSCPTVPLFDRSSVCQFRYPDFIVLTKKSPNRGNSPLLPAIPFPSPFPRPDTSPASQTRWARVNLETRSPLAPGQQPKHDPPKTVPSQPEHSHSGSIVAPKTGRRIVRQLPTMSPDRSPFSLQPDSLRQHYHGQKTASNTQKPQTEPATKAGASKQAPCSRTLFCSCCLIGEYVPFVFSPVVSLPVVSLFVSLITVPVYCLSNVFFFASILQHPGE